MTPADPNVSELGDGGTVAKAQRARGVVLRAYERGRFQSAVFAAFLALCLVLPGVWLAELTPHALALALLLAVLVVSATHRGGELARMALPATLLGLMPLACALFAARFGHACTSGGCVSLCVPMCTAGGLVSGAWLGLVAARGQKPIPALVFGGAVLIVVGAIGCSCVGISGLLAMSAAAAFASLLTSAYRRC